MRRLALVAAAIFAAACTTPDRSATSARAIEDMESVGAQTEANPTARSLDEAQREWADIETAAAAKHGTDREPTPEELAEQESVRLAREEQERRQEEERAARDARIEAMVARVEVRSDVDLGIEQLHLQVMDGLQDVSHMWVYAQRGATSFYGVKCLAVTSEVFMFVEAASQGESLECKSSTLESDLDDNFKWSFSTLVFVDFMSSHFDDGKDRTLLLHSGTVKVRTTVPWEAIEALRRARLRLWGKGQ